MPMCVGRLDDAFDDRNESVVNDLLAKHPELHTLEMETFHLCVELDSLSQASTLFSRAAV